MSKRDFLLIPLISLLTVIAMFGVSEVVTRMVWSEHEENECIVDDDSDVGYHYKPNCSVTTKSAESPWASYHFNECAYRSDTSCGPTPSGAIRIAILGASISQGLYVDYPKSYFGITAAALTQACKRPIDVQNMGKPRSSPIYAYKHEDEALALKPDVLLILLAPFDLEQRISPKALAERNDPEATINRAAVRDPLTLMRRVQLLLTGSRTVLVAEHFLLQNKDTFLRLYLNYGDKADFLRQPFTPAWEERFANIDLIFADMAAKANAAGVPLVIVPVPSRAEAALLSSAHTPPGVDAFAFGRRLEQIAAKHGATYVDLMDPFSHIPDAQNLFLVVDGHVNADGQKVIAEELTKKLLDGSVPALAQCTAPVSATP